MTLKELRELVSQYPESCDELKVLTYHEADEIITGHWSELESYYIQIGEEE